MNCYNVVEDPQALPSQAEDAPNIYCKKCLPNVLAERRRKGTGPGGIARGPELIFRFTSLAALPGAAWCRRDRGEQTLSTLSQRARPRGGKVPKDQGSGVDD